MDKQNIQKIQNFITQYQKSILTLIGIVSVKIGDEKFKENVTFCDIRYPLTANKEIYQRWVQNHVYLEVFELSREFLQAFLDIEKPCEGKMNLWGLIIKLNELGFLEKNKKHKKYIDSYNKIRNCITHRSGIVTKDDIGNNPALKSYNFSIRFNIRDEGGKCIKTSVNKDALRKFYSKPRNPRNKETCIEYKPTLTEEIYEINDLILMKQEAIMATMLFWDDIVRHICGKLGYDFIYKNLFKTTFVFLLNDGTDIKLPIRHKWPCDS